MNFPDHDPAHEALATSLRDYMAARADKVCRRCGKRYDAHEIIVIAEGTAEVPDAAATTFDTMLIRLTTNE